MIREKTATIASYETELLVIGRSLNDHLAHNHVVKTLEEEDFFDSDLRLLFRLLCRLYEQDKPAGIVFILEALRNIKDKHHLNPSFLTTIAQNAIGDIDLRYYIDLLKQKTATRRFYFLMKEHFNHFDITAEHPIIKMQSFQDSLFEIMEPLRKKDNFSHILKKKENSQTSFIDDIEKKWLFRLENKQDFLSGLTTGFFDLDKKTVLLEKGNLVVIAARPSVGKTAFALNLALHVCLSLNKSVGFFSLEMSQEQIVERVLSYKSEVSVEDLRRGNFTKEQLQNVKKAEKTLLRSSFFVCDTGISTIDQIVFQSEQLSKKKDLDIIFIDYLQLISTDNKKENRQNEVANVSMKLKCLAKQLNIPIVCLSQLSRKVEERSDKRPLMSDLRDSGQIEQDADAILLLHNKDQKSNSDNEIINVFLCKNRHGPTFSFHLNFLKSFGVFSICDHNW